jgi:FkbM family methyltransferase
MSKAIKRFLLQLGRTVLPSKLKLFLLHYLIAILDLPERRRANRYYNMNNLKWTLQNLGRIGKPLEQIVDVGAYEGEWTDEVLAVFPQARSLMVEGQPAKEPILRSTTAKHGDQVKIAIGLVGSEPKDQVEFYEMETGSSVLYEQCNADRKKVTRSMTTVDLLVEKNGIQRIDLLKIDVQGYELEVLRGATKSLAKTDLVLLEVSLLPIIKGAPLMPETVSFMSERGFTPYEICSLMRRPLDDALWQVDMLFVRRDSALVSNHTKGD